MALQLRFKFEDVGELDSAANEAVVFFDVNAEDEKVGCPMYARVDIWILPMHATCCTNSRILRVCVANPANTSRILRVCVANPV